MDVPILPAEKYDVKSKEKNARKNDGKIVKDWNFPYCAWQRSRYSNRTITDSTMLLGKVLKVRIEQSP